MVEPTEKDRRNSRICHCIIVIPFFIVLVLSIISFGVFVVKNEYVKQNCGVGCVLNCYNDLDTECWIVSLGGALLSLTVAVFIVVLIVRMLIGSKINGGYTVFEMLVLLFLLALSLLVVIVLTLGAEGNVKSCLNETYTKCDDEDVLDFLDESKIASGLSSSLLVFLSFVWVLRSLAVCCQNQAARRRAVDVRVHLIEEPQDR